MFSHSFPQAKTSLSKKVYDILYTHLFINVSYLERILKHMVAIGAGGNDGLCLKTLCLKNAKYIDPFSFFVIHPEMASAAAAAKAFPPVVFHFFQGSI